MKKVAALIAAGSGMGADCAKRLFKDGYKVALMSSSGKALKLAKKLNGLGFTGSNLNKNDIENFIKMIQKKWGRIDVLVNSAGHGPKGQILKLSDKDWIIGMETYFLKI